MSWEPTEAEALFHTNRFRVDGEHGWTEPKTENEHGHPTHLASMAEQASSAVAGQLHALFGAQGMATLRDMAPTLFADIRETVIEAYREGHHDAFGEAIIASGNEASRRTSSMVVALLHSTVEGEDRKDTALRALAAHAGVSQDDLEAGGLVGPQGEE